jgi:hypothetical protein
LEFGLRMEDRRSKIANAEISAAMLSQRRISLVKLLASGSALPWRKMI